MPMMNSRFAQTLLAAAIIAVTAPLAAQEAGPAPRTADGKPDFSGVWWTGGDLGSPTYASSTGPMPDWKTFTDLYTDEAKAHAATLGDKDDPTLQCQPTAFGTLSVRLFDVGTVGQIVSTPGMMVF